MSKANLEATEEYARRVAQKHAPGAHVMVVGGLSQNYVRDGREGPYTVIRCIGGNDYKLASGFLTLEDAEDGGWDVIMHASRIVAPHTGED